MSVSILIFRRKTEEGRVEKIVHKIQIHKENTLPLKAAK